MKRVMLFATLLAVLGFGSLAFAQAPTATPTTDVHVAVFATPVPMLSPHKLTMAAASADLKVLNDGNEFLLVQTAGTPTTITVTSVAEQQLGRTGDLTVTTDATGLTLIPPLRPGGFNQRSGVNTGYVYVHFTATTSVTYAWLRLNF